MARFIMPEGSTGLGCCMQQVKINAQEVGKAVKRSAQFVESGRYGRLQVIFTEFSMLHQKKPSYIKGAQVAAAQFRAYREQRRKTWFVVPLKAFVPSTE